MGGAEQSGDQGQGFAEFVHDGGGKARRAGLAIALTTVIALAPFAAGPGFATGSTDGDGSQDSATTEETEAPADTEDTDAPADEDTAAPADEDAEEGADTEDAEQEVQLLPGPALPGNAPSELDVNPGWNWTTTCDPQTRPGTQAVATLLSQHFGRAAWSGARACLPYDSEHHEGRAIDWTMDSTDPADKLIGDSVVAWLIADDGANARRLGVQSVIWNRQAWHNYAPDKGLKPYNGPSPHADHVHISLTWDGAYMRTSWWTGIPLTQPDLGPCATYEDDYAARYAGPRYGECETGTRPDTGLATVLPGDGGEGVALVQDALGIERTGTFDEATLAALLVWQAEQRIPVSGVLDQATYAAAYNATGGVPVATEEPASEETAEGSTDDVATTEDEDAEAPAPTTFSLVDVAPPAAKTPFTTEFTPFFGAELGVGDEGDGVRLLQQALGLEDDGVFGARTAAALREYTTEHPWLLPAEETSPLLWKVLELQYYPTVPLRGNTVEVGDSGPLVQTLQDQLELDTDGRFGPGTQAAVEAAQAEAGLPQTGVVDAATWAAIDEAKPDGEFHGDLLDITAGAASDDGWFVPLPVGYAFVDGFLQQQAATLESVDR